MNLTKRLKEIVYVRKMPYQHFQDIIMKEYAKLNVQKALIKIRNYLHVINAIIRAWDVVNLQVHLIALNVQKDLIELGIIAYLYANKMNIMTLS